LDVAQLIPLLPMNGRELLQYVGIDPQDLGLCGCEVCVHECMEHCAHALRAGCIVPYGFDVARDRELQVR
jgi:hypothetical protein